MQENAGHLLDLESLVSQRIDEYLAGNAALHAADMSNRKTHEANHNNVTADSILKSFRTARHDIVNRLESFDAEIFDRSALHPRLNVPMRLVDMLFFQAEHDDYHLARISELKKIFHAKPLTLRLCETFAPLREKNPTETNYAKGFSYPDVLVAGSTER